MPKVIEWVDDMNREPVQKKFEFPDYTVITPPEDVKAAIASDAKSSVDAEVIFHKPTEAEKKIASDLVSLIKDGKRPSEAAQMLGGSMKSLMTLPKVREAVKNMIETYTLHADVRRMLVRAAANQTLIHTMGVPGQEKVALEAAKLIGADPEVGIGNQVAIGIMSDKETLEKLFAKPVDLVFADEEPVKDDSKGT